MLATLLGVALALAGPPQTSGLEIGERVATFHPWHVTGPNKGTDACPP